MTRATPIASGVALAFASAVAFGLTIPVLGWAGAGVGAFTSAALLYLGASAAALLQQRVVDDAGAPLTKRAWGPLLVTALAGAALAPTLFAWGVQRAGPVTSGLLLNLEAVWTVVLARVFFREHLGRRVLLALGLMTCGGVLAALRPGELEVNVLGVLAVLGATLGWAADNTASRRLAEMKPLTVVAAKGALGVLVTLSLSRVFGEPLPEAWRAGVLLLAGATGYGLSLRLYLLAQRRIGSARTASVFAVAPFLGAALGLVVTPEVASWQLGAAAVLFALGVVLHAFERHAHAHRHTPTEHEHAHRHDDGHHEHVHEFPVHGEHSHPHAHAFVEHSHEHADDVHHDHTH